MTKRQPLLPYEWYIPKNRDAINHFIRTAGHKEMIPTNEWKVEFIEGTMVLDIVTAYTKLWQK